MKICRPKSAPGFAVIIALVAVTVLSFLAGALALSMKVESRLAVNSSHREQLLWIGRGGVQRACWILANEPPGPSSLKQVWAGGAGVGAETNGPLAGITLNNFPVGKGTVSLKITEEESKININTADAVMLRQVLTVMGVDAGDISVVSDSILDWIDPNDIPRPAGAESDYYQGLNPPYYAKNAPIDNIQELQLIRGVTPAMFNGSGPQNPNAPFIHHHLGFGNTPGQQPYYPFGLRDVFTPYSIGKININTASTNVLQLIPGMDTPTLQGIVAFRSSDNGGPAGPGVFTSVGQLQQVASNPQVYQQLARYCTVRGETYKVQALARIGNVQREYVAVVYRGPRSVEVVSFHAK